MRLRRFEGSMVLAGAVALGGFALLRPTAIDYAIYAVGVIAIVPAVISLNYAIPRAPRLRIEYRNPEVRGEAAVWQGRGCKLYVYVVNNGRGSAEGLEARFDTLGASVFNETGNTGDRRLDVSLHPPRYVAADRVLNPGQEWCLAMLTWHGSLPPAGADARWTASAKGAAETSGTVTVSLAEPQGAP